MRILYQAIFILLIVSCLLGAAYFQRDLDATRSAIRDRTIIGEAPSDPEIVLLTHLLGGFKGLLVDAVWLRANMLQQDDKYWELYTLYNWMGKLEPHLETIWVFNGWNMAYNLIANLSNNEARWLWIWRAITYMRDEGLKYNPQSSEIMKQISWTFYHKIGQYHDDNHLYYKHRLALVMNSIMGDRDMQDMKGVRDAPKDLETLLKDEEIRRVIGRRYELDPDVAPVSQLDDAQGIYGIPRVIHSLIYAEKPEGMSYGEFMKTPEGSVARKIVNFVVARTLVEQLKMKDLDLIVEMEEKYNQFDWRMPEPHALYWGELASRRDRHVNPASQKQIDYDRMVIFSLVQLARRGNIAYMGPVPSGTGGTFITTTDFSKIEPVHQLYLEMMQKYPVVDYGLENRGSTSIRDGHYQFVRWAVFTLYFSGYEGQAENYYLIMRALHNKPAEPMSLEDWNIGRVQVMVDEYGTYAQIRSFIDSLLFKAIYSMCVNDYNTARQSENLARRAWNAFLTDDEKHRQARLDKGGRLPTFEEIYESNVRVILTGQNPLFPQRLVPVLRSFVGVKEGEELIRIEPGEGLAPPAPAQSPIDESPHDF